ncbi:prolyl oligopeptidase family serine peptidase [Candidatus Falkowbacteria bacterium]|nr:prolyl oligopeptidase family serine peptidase [Candidatus Falkowbacteria bacterium]
MNKEINIKFNNNRKLTINKYTFKSVDGLAIPAYFIYPKKNIKQKIPCVVTCSAGIHGSFYFKESKNFDDFHLNWCWHLIKNNIAVLYIDKRGSYGYGTKFQNYNEVAGKEVDDIAYGVRILNDFNFIDKTRIYGLGISRTCNSFVLAELKYNLFNALFLISGFYNIKEQFKTTKQKHLKELLGKYNTNNFPYNKRSSILFVNKLKSDFPILLLHGKNDQTVFFNQSLDFYTKLIKSSHNHVKFIKYNNLPHTREASSTASSSGRRILKILLSFIKSH